MTGPSLQVSCVGLADGLAAELIPLAESAGLALELASHVSGIRICGDDLPGEGGFWCRLEPGSRPDELPVLVLFCHGGCFGLRKPFSDSVYPPRAVWEQSPAPVEEFDGDDAGFSGERSAVFLHHHLLTARDIIRGDLMGRKLSAAQAEAARLTWMLLQWLVPTAQIRE